MVLAYFWNVPGLVEDADHQLFKIPAVYFPLPFWMDFFPLPNPHPPWPATFTSWDSAERRALTQPFPLLLPPLHLQTHIRTNSKNIFRGYIERCKANSHSAAANKVIRACAEQCEARVPSSTGEHSDFAHAAMTCNR